MIVDSSAVVAILCHEPERYVFLDAVRAAGSAAMSAGTYVETGIVVDAWRAATLSRGLDELLMDLAIRIEPVTASQAALARAAYRDFGKGSGHAAGLNFGDCLSYALAKDKREPLLYKGNDFVHTDIEPAV